MSEQTVQRKIKKDFKALGGHVTKVNPGIFGAESGHADLIISIPITIPTVEYLIIPICLYVEVKTDTGELSAIQKIWHKQMLDGGHLVCVARNTQDALDYLLSQGIKL